MLYNDIHDWNNHWIFLLTIFFSNHFFVERLTWKVWRKIVNNGRSGGGGGGGGGGYERALNRKHSIICLRFNDSISFFHKVLSWQWNYFSSFDNFSNSSNGNTHSYTIQFQCWCSHARLSCNLPWHSRVQILSTNQTIVQHNWGSTHPSLWFEYVPRVLSTIHHLKLCTEKKLASHILGWHLIPQLCPNLYDSAAELQLAYNIWLYSYIP